MDVKIAIESIHACRGFLTQEWRVPCIFNTIESTMAFINDSPNPLHLHGYFGSLPNFSSDISMSKLFAKQLKFIQYLQENCNLDIFILTYFPTHTPTRIIRKFLISIQHAGWISTNQEIHTAAFSDAVAMQLGVIYGVHSKNTTPSFDVSHIHTPPSIPNSFGSYLLNAYNNLTVP